MPLHRQRVSDLRIADQNRRAPCRLVHIAQQRASQPQPRGRGYPILPSDGSRTLEVHDPIGRRDVLRDFQLTRNHGRMKPAGQLVDDSHVVRQQLSSGSRIAHFVRAFAKKPDAPASDMQTRSHPVPFVW